MYFGPVEVRNWQIAGAEQVITYPTLNAKLVNGVKTFLHRDALGSVRAITDAAGVKIESAVYKPFGEQSEWLSAAQMAPEAKGWIGERYDADAGLQYLNARYYDPQLGMFLQPDWFEVMQPGVGTNRFSYAFNDPVNKIDPGGNATYVEPNNDTDREDDYTVKEVTNDKDFGIYVRDEDQKKEKLRKLGETRFWDAFISPDSHKPVGTIYEGYTFDREFRSLAEQASTLDALDLALASSTHGFLNVKAKDYGLTQDVTKSYDGVLLDGKYMTMREIGNALAGYNAAVNGQTYDDFQRVAGALQVEGLSGAFTSAIFGKSYGEKPFYGEKPYQGTRLRTH